MITKISDVALDLGIFAMDSEIENSVTRSLYPLGSQAWKRSVAWDWIDAEGVAVAS